MTAEIAIVNKGAVVLAADSAVTINVGGSEKIYNSVNKIFDLNMACPIGIMVYGNLEFMGVPLETIIKLYRRERNAQSFSTIKEVAENFIEYLQNCPHVTDDDQIANVGSILASRYRELYETFYARFLNTMQKESSAFTTHANDVLSDLADRGIKAARRLRRPSGISANEESKIFEVYQDAHDEIIKEIFQHIKLYKNTQNKLRELSKLWLCRPTMSPIRTGVVIAGFGTSEIFPSLVNIEIDGIIRDRLKSVYVDSIEIDRSGTSGADIIPFAQKEMVERFLKGVDPDFEAYSFRQFSQILLAAGTKLIGEHLVGTEEAKNQAISKFSDFVRDSIESLKKKTNGFKDQNFRKKVLDMVLFMPKQELANMAESLINLTSLKRRVSAERETVGGPVDVAVISKDEGFVWIKRKHYFDKDLNPRYFVRLGT
jgi:hypothetical protein